MLVELVQAHAQAVSVSPAIVITGDALYAAAGPAPAIAVRNPVLTQPPWSRWPQLPNDVSADLGGIVRYRTAHAGTKKPVEDAYPVIEVNVGDRLQISLDDGIKYQALKGKTWSAGPVVEYRESFTDKLPHGARLMPNAVEAGGFVTWKSPLGDVETRLRRALDGYDGWSGDLSFDTGGYVTPKLGIGLELRSEWADAYFTGRYMGAGPRDNDGVFALPQFGPRDYVTAGAQVTVGYKVTKTTTAFVQTSLDRIYGEAWRPPVLQTRNLMVIGAGLTWHFGAPRPDAP